MVRKEGRTDRRYKDRRKTDKGHSSQIMVIPSYVINKVFLLLSLYMTMLKIVLSS